VVYGVVLGAIVVAGFLLRVPRFRDPLEPDFGAHLYLAQTWHDGKRLYYEVPAGKPPGLYYLYMAVYRWWGRGPVAFRSFIAIWYSATTVAVYFLSLATWHNPAAALVSAGIFALLTAIPQYKASHSQPNNFMLLLETLALALCLWSHHGIVSFIAGALIGTAFLFKVTALAPLALLGLWSLAIQHSLVNAALLGAGFAVASLAPLPHFWHIGRLSAAHFLDATFNVGGLFAGFLHLFRRNLPGYREREESVRSRARTLQRQYIRARYRKPITHDLELARARLARLASTTGWLWILVFMAAISQRSANGMLVAAACVLALVGATVQRSYFPLHYLPAAPAASALAGWLIWESVMVLHVQGAGAIGAAFVLTLALLAALRMAASWYVQSFVYSAEDALIFNEGLWSKRWIAANEVAELFRAEVPPHEYVLQYGENPQVYYLSGRRSASVALTWVYPTPRPDWQDMFVRDVNERRPAMIAFFERYLDMAAVQPRVEPTYRLKTMVAGEFPVYARVDDPIDELRTADVYLFDARAEPVRFDRQQAPTAAFLSLAVLCNKVDRDRVTALGRSLGEPTEIVCMERSVQNGDRYEAEYTGGVKVLRVPRGLSPPACFNRAVQVARGDRILFVTDEDGLPDASTCRSIVAALNADSHVGLSARTVVPAVFPIAIRSVALFRSRHLDTAYRTLSAAIADLAYHLIWSDYDCKEIDTEPARDLPSLPVPDSAHFHETLSITIEDFTRALRNRRK